MPEARAPPGSVHASSKRDGSPLDEDDSRLEKRGSRLEEKLLRELRRDADHRPGVHILGGPLSGRLSSNSAGGIYAGKIGIPGEPPGRSRNSNRCRLLQKDNVRWSDDSNTRGIPTPSGGGDREPARIA